MSITDMRVQPEVKNPVIQNTPVVDLGIIDGIEYMKQKEEYDEKCDAFMRRYLRRAWPRRIVILLGVLQLLLSLAILGIDLPIILMFAPRWQVFAGCWTFLFGFITCVSTIHSTRKTTWLKLKWTVALNLLGALAASFMVAFDILFLVNPYMCVNISGCNYLSYTYSVVKPFYIGQLVLGIFLIITAFLLIILFLKYGIGGTKLFDDIQEGRAPVIHKPMVRKNGTSRGKNPMVGPGVINMPPPGAMMIPGPRGPMMVPDPMLMHGPPGPMMPPDPMMMPPGPMMMPGPQGPMMPPGPMMMPGPQGSMMPPGPMMMPPGPMMMPGPRGPMMPPGPLVIRAPRGTMMPPGPLVIRAPRGLMMPPGPMMFPGPRGPMMSPGPMMFSGPRGPMMPPGPMMFPGPRGPMVVPGPRGHMPGYYEQQPVYPPHY